MKYKSYPGALLLVFLCVCANTSAQQDAPVLHAIYSEELRNIMLRMNRLVYEREMTALQAQEIRERHLQELIDTVSELVNSAEDLTQAVPGIDLDKQEHITFKAMARQLLNETQNIKQLAQENDYPAIESAYQDLDDTCNACHRLFRF